MMNQLEAVMADETCPTPTADPPAPICPRTGRATLPIGHVTVTSHVAAGVPAIAFGFCDVPTCSTVYVGADGRLIDKADLRTRVGMKEAADPIPVCYCFDYTERQIIEDVRAHGRSTIREYISEQVQGGRCRCVVTNPSGRCCLGNVARAVWKARRGGGGFAQNVPSGADFLGR